MTRDYIYHSFTRTLCSKCCNVVDGKIVYNKKGVFILKNCPDCGEGFELLEEDAQYHLQKYKYDKPGTSSASVPADGNACPHACGLCENHDQHTCIGLIEITGSCNLACPMCYADSGADWHLSLDAIERMMDFYMEAEGGAAELLQISGGEPTMHGDVLKVIEMARDKGFKYVMLNTNGIKLAEDEGFARELSRFRGGFEVYLQFDGLDDRVYATQRGRSLADVKKKALANLNRFNIPTTFVAAVENGVNDHLCGEIVALGMNEACVRGISFQPVAYYANTAPPSDRLTLSGVLNRLEAQTGGMIRMSDFMPLPCNVERVAFTYLFRDKNGFMPITRDRDLSEFKDLIGNTFVFTIEETLESFTNDSKIFGGACCDLIVDIKKYLPKNFILKSKAERIKFVDENTFRITCSSFVDKYNFDMKSMQKECVHIITPDLKRIPFSSYNMLHRRRV